MKNDKEKKRQKITALYNQEGAGECCVIQFFLFLIVGMISFIVGVASIWIGLIVFIVFILIVVFLHLIFSVEYCTNCNKRVYPIFSDHYCKLDIKSNKLKVKESFFRLLTQNFKQIEKGSNRITKLNIFKNDYEKEIFENNLRSLKIFETLNDYKYCMIAMGSILEFLLIRYCKNNNFEPETYTDPFGNITKANKKQFANYVQAVILNDILGQRNSWYIVQNNLRNFRNYVHLNKEVKEERIDENWYNTIKPVFERILESFG